ncbi:MAG: haloacid dehalogenase type II [Xenococcaceae cyanobacterium MO_188.B29]|nr:haloacid dehalogenase type II [Xenococcaceae cyanobacterium MO_188.B29]
MIDFNQYKIITFDCYGTLIDWESGMLGALKPLLASHGVDLEDEEILKKFAEFESAQEQGEYSKYYDVLKAVVRKFGEEFNFEPSLDEQNSLPDSIKNWQPFPDTVKALQLLKSRFKLAIISNVDDALFADTAKLLGVEFDYIITAEQVKSYKPDLKNFKYAIDLIEFPAEQIIHAACSVYHDIIPASSLGLTTVWIDRRANQEGSGAALPATAQADLKITDLQTLANLSFNEV